ncbi:hypothetical protein HDU91_002931 [Kappamyces sp. JEL0680]|nr:hypothetical protein HDU91_002931 [Kappamyces sp. JEL0680]
MPLNAFLDQLFPLLKWTKSELENTRGLLQQLLATSTDAVVEDIVKTQLARTYGLESQFQQGHALLDQLSTKDSDLVTGLCAMERGRLFRSSGAVADAKPLFHQAWDSFSSVDLDACPNASFFLVDAGHMVCLVEPDKTEKANWYRKCIAIAAASPVPKTRRWLGSLYNNLGWDLHDEKQYHQALEMFEKGLAIRLELGDSPETVFIAKWAIARAQRSLERWDLALQTQETLVQDAAHGQQDGYVWEELMELYAQRGDQSKSKDAARKAQEYLGKDAWFVANEKTRWARIQELAL